MEPGKTWDPNIKHGGIFALKPETWVKLTNTIGEVFKHMIPS